MERALSRLQASDAVTGLGWRFLLGTLCTSVRVGSLGEAAEVAAGAVEACGDEADEHLRADLRPDRVALTLQSLDQAWVTARDVELAGRITAALRDRLLRTEPGIGPGTGPELGAGETRSVQVIEIAIDATDIAAIRPFWKALLGYADEAGSDGNEDPLVDPVRQGPAIWFQRMDEPRTDRNRIHLDICVPHDEAARRLEAALAAGGRVVSDAAAPAFWVLADIEGNEACITTWQGRGD